MSQNDAALSTVVDKAFNQIVALSQSETASRLFPSGLNLIQVEIDITSQFKFSLVLSSQGKSERPTEALASITPEIEEAFQSRFNAEGHHVVAFIAKEDLKTRYPATLEKVERILTAGGRSWASAAAFPDDIRQSQPETKPFHFVDIPFDENGPKNPPFPAGPNVVTKIPEFGNLLKSATDPKNKVDALSWVIHLVGDIHQPLHCIEHISAIHPAGDHGGNSFHLSGSFRNLHSLWDSSVSFVHADDETLALDIINQHPRTSLASELQVKEIAEWARTSFGLAKAFAYGPLVEDPKSPPKPSKEYLKKAEAVGRKQAALAGYRLADQLHSILG